MGAELRQIDEGLELKARRLRGEPRPAVRQEVFLSKGEVARHYAVTTTTIDTWSREGLPWHRVGARRKFRLSETDEWMESTGRLS